MNPRLSNHIHEFCTLLAKAIFESKPERSSKRLVELRRAILSKRSELSGDEFNVIAGLDAIYRTVRRNIEPITFSVAACREESIKSFRVAIVEDGEIRHMVRISRDDDAVYEAEAQFLTDAWPGSTVLLMAELADGKLINCDHKRVGPKP